MAYSSRLFIVGIGIAAAITSVLLSIAHDVTTPLTYLIGPAFAFATGCAVAFMLAELLGPPLKWLFAPTPRDLHLHASMRPHLERDVDNRRAGPFRAFMVRLRSHPKFHGGLGLVPDYAI